MPELGKTVDEELKKLIVNQSLLPADTQNAFSQVLQFEEFMMMFNCAIKEVRTKFEVLNEDLAVRCKRNPIEFIQSRVKKPVSIVRKLQSKNLEISLSSVLYNLNDVAGVRVICSFVDDIYTVADMFSRQDDVTVISVKDYITHPKPNGYRSYHMIVEIPVYFSDRKQPIRVEVQIRTIAMDFWASLEHKLKYKKEINNTEEIEAELKNCAEIISKTDLKMQDIMYTIDTLEEKKQ